VKKAGGNAGFFVGWIIEIVMAGQKRKVSSR